MAGKSGKIQAMKADKSGAKPEPANDEGDLPLADLARGILAREIRPRIAQIRRLAEAVLTAAERGAKKGGKKGKLARIAGQKKKRKN